MESVYAPNVQFKDEIFEYKDRSGAMNMWRTIFGKAPDLKSTYKITSVEGDTVKAHWVADYTFFGRPVHNEVDATMSTTSTVGYLEQTTASEVTVDRETYVSEHNLFLPATTVIDGSDRVVVDGW